jgi:hypothetical protein
MNLDENSQNTAPHDFAEARVNRFVRDLFRQLPRLTAFRLGSDLTVVEVFGGSFPDDTSIRGLYSVVRQSIIELAECHPELAQLMRDRTFARSLN